MVVVDMETTASAPVHDAPEAAGSVAAHETTMMLDNGGDDDDLLLDDEMEATQRLEDEPIAADATETASEPTPPLESATPTPTAAAEDAAESFDFVGASKSARPFAAAFGVVWRVLQQLGWQTAQGPGTEFVSMPGTQFFNFRPNINVFDSKGKACWKWIALAATDRDDNKSAAADDAVVWETLWTIAEKEFGWYTMSSGNETWFVRPNTQFAEFQPNVTIFQSKKRAVLQALAGQKVKIELGDSVEGVQVIDFAAKPETESAKPKAKKDKPSDTPKSKSKSDSFTTPPPKKSSAAAQSSSKKTSKPTPSSTKKSGKASGLAKKSTPAKANGKSPKTPKNAKKGAEKEAASATKRPEKLFVTPEFKCTFGHVYKKLQERGWHHRAGTFEYDYFSPDYTKETAIHNGNYFQSAAEFESFLKDSGMWADIEAELHDEHDVMVKELRQEMEEKHQRLKERAAAQVAKAKARSTPAKEKPTPRSPAKSKKKSAFQKALMESGSKRKSLTSELEASATPPIKITMGKVVDKLLKRGWHYKPGRFEYDYFKPNVTAKTAKLGEDFFQSEAELETHLKVSGLWAEIAQEIRDEFNAKRNASSDDDSNQQDAKKKTAPPPAKKARVEPQEDQPLAAVFKSPRGERREDDAEPLEPAAAALTNDIWGNSHQFDFEKY